MIKFQPSSAFPFLKIMLYLFDQLCLASQTSIPKIVQKKNKKTPLSFSCAFFFFLLQENNRIKFARCLFSRFTVMIIYANKAIFSIRLYCFSPKSSGQKCLINTNFLLIQSPKQYILLLFYTRYSVQAVCVQLTQIQSTDRPLWN